MGICPAGAMSMPIEPGSLSMADPDFDVIRRSMSAAGRKDMKAFRADLHPDICAIPFGAVMEGKRYEGIDAVVGWLRDEIWESWETFDTVPEELCRVDDSILVRGHWRATGKGSGVDLVTPAMWVFRLRDGKISYWQTYTDHDQALEAVGVDRWPCAR